jgi:hypothetical protein
MTLAQIAGFINQGCNQKLTPEQILVFIDTCQKQAFDYDAIEFKTWQDLQTSQILYFQSADFTISTADIGETLTGATSGATGTIVDASSGDWNTNAYVIVDCDGDAYSTGELCNATGASGSLLTSDFQETWKGPYDAPTDPPVRKIHGVILATDAEIYGTHNTTEVQTDDYGIPIVGYVPDRLFIPGRVNNLEKQFLFSSPPSESTGVVATEPAYRWVYWRTAPDINDFGDTANLIIPAQYHSNLAKACVMEANAFLMNEIVDPENIRAFFKPWWETLRRQYTPMGVATNLKSMPRQNGDVMV